MSVKRIAVLVACLAVLGGLGVAGWLTRAHWQPLFDSESEEAKDDRHDHGHADRVKITEQGRRNLKLIVGPVEVSKSHWRRIVVPGIIVDRPGQSDQGVTAPITGVVTKIHAFPSDTVKPGTALFTLRLTSELVLNTQSELFKAGKDKQLNDQQIKLLEDAAKSGAIPQARVTELKNIDARLQARMQSYRQILQASGLTSAQIDSAGKGTFVRDVTVVAPPTVEESALLRIAAPKLPAAVPTPSLDRAYEVEKLNVELGTQIQAGQVLGMLSNHRLLYIKGRGFKSEAGKLAKAAESNWPVEAEFSEDDAKEWPALQQTLAIRHLANTVDPASRTFDFFLPLINRARGFTKEGKTFLAWRFRPGQRVKLRVPVEEFKNVLVVPAAAVVREGAEAYVFAANGKVFDRKAVHIVHEDRQHMVLADDGDIGAGSEIALNAAAALNRVLKAQKSEGEGGGHHGHSH